MKNIDENKIENLPKISLLVAKIIIPLMTNLLALPCFKIGNLREIMDNFTKEMSKGQLETLDLLNKIIKQKLEQNEKIRNLGKIEEINQQILEPIPELTLSKYADIGNSNENLVFKNLANCFDVDGKIAKTDFEYCLTKIIEEIQIIESQKIYFENAQNGEPILTEDEQNIIGWVYSNPSLSPNLDLNSSLVKSKSLDYKLSLEEKLKIDLQNFEQKEIPKEAKIVTINLAGANNHTKNEKKTNGKIGESNVLSLTEIGEYNDKIRKIIQELQRIRLENQSSTVFFCQEVPFDKNLPIEFLNLGEEIAKMGGTAIFVLQENCGNNYDNQVAIITFDPQILGKENQIKIIPTNKIGDFGAFMKMPNKIATQTLVLFQIETSGKIHQICSSHQLAPTTIIQRILSRVVEMALLTTQSEKLQVKTALGDHNQYGISADKPFFKVSDFVVPNLPYAFLIPALINLISGGISNLAKENNSEQVQTLAQKFSKNHQEIEVVQELCKLVGLVYPESREPSFNHLIPAYYLDMAMLKKTKTNDNLKNLEIGEISLNPECSDHRIARIVVIKNQ